MRVTKLAAMLISTLALPPLACPQAPVIESVQNSASKLNITGVASQMILTIMGQNLATSTEEAHGFPLPTTLGGATVTLNAPQVLSGWQTSLPLLYVSPTQINAQMSSGAATLEFPTNFFTVTVSTPLGSNNPISITLDPMNLGIFTQDATGCGQAVAFNIHSDGRPLSMNTPQNSFDPDSDIGLAILFTGLGYFPDRRDGLPFEYDPLIYRGFLDDNTSPVALYFGAPESTGVQLSMSPQYLGPSPGTAGVDQMNAVANWVTGLKFPVPAQGCRVPMFLSNVQYLWPGESNASQLVSVSIQPGRGNCVDPPEGTLGLVTWRKTAVSDIGGVTVSEAITAQFLESGGLGFPSAGPAVSMARVPAGYTPVWVAPVPVACPASLPPSLDAGILTVSGPGITGLTLAPVTNDGQIVYEASLSDSAVQSGSYLVSGLGGSQVGPFRGAGLIPAPITITSDLHPGVNLSTIQQGSGGCPSTFPPPGYAYTFTWTGGDDRSLVTLEFLVRVRYPMYSDAPTYLFHVAASAPASDQKITVPASWCVEYPGAITIPPGDVELIFTQTPATAPSNPFSAPGLGMGGDLNWRYVFDYKGLTNF